MTSTGSPHPELRRILDLQRAAFAADMYPTLDARRDRLARLLAMTDRIGQDAASALSADFGYRSSHVTRLADLMMVRAAIKHARRKLPRWMRIRRAPTAMAFQPGRSRILPQPLGVVGIVAPWNYPYQLTIGPAIAALAAGNRVMLKPSELTPRFSLLLEESVAREFAPEEMTVLNGDALVSKDFVSLPLDHLLFTGSTAVGRRVALAAADNLTPVTLELGGKSPAILNHDCNLSDAASRLIVGKLINAGQTCIAPDYAAVPRPMLGDFISEMQKCCERLYPGLPENPDYTSIVSDRHFERLHALLQDAEKKGARIIPLASSVKPPTGRIMTPALVIDSREDMLVMQDEVFGPILPVIVYERPEEIVAYINRRPRPLALYWFGKDRATRDLFLRGTVSGGVTINDCLWHFGQEELPFGGVGASGMGAYHGETGFRTFSQFKPIFYQSALSGVPLLFPPYGRVFELMARVLKLIT